MYSREESTKIHSFFWNEFKAEMSQIRSCNNGRKVNWFKYPTEIKGFYVRLHVDANSASLLFDIQIKDPSVREIIWEQLNELKNVIFLAMKSHGNWIEHCQNEFVSDFCRIEWKLENVSLYKEENKAEIFSFLKQKLIDFDAFYQNYKEILILLVK
jgi:hypothetical protein